MAFLPFALPDIGYEEINEVIDTLESGWITTGPKIMKFEKAFSEYIGSKYSISVNSATAGLHLALDAIGLERDDLVITSPYTFTATAEVIRYFDAHPVFCDINEKTFNIDVQKLEDLLKKLCAGKNHKVKAIMPVHFAGQTCDMNEIMSLAQKYNLKIIEDAAHSLPATCNNKMIGTIGDITVFSFYATKSITTGEGGMITTNNEAYKDKMSKMRLHGINKDSWDRYVSPEASWSYDIIGAGYKYNMTDIAASIGLQQLKKCDYFFEKRNKIAERYTESFKNLNRIETPFVKNKNDKHSWHLYVIKVKNKMRDKFISIMKEKEVGCSVHFIPLHIQTYWKEKYNLKPDDFPVAYSCFCEAVSLPAYAKMPESDIEKVIQAVIETHNKIFS